MSIIITLIKTKNKLFRQVNQNLQKFHPATCPVIAKRLYGVIRQLALYPYGAIRKFPNRLPHPTANLLKTGFRSSMFPEIPKILPNTCQTSPEIKEKGINHKQISSPD